MQLEDKGLGAVLIQQRSMLGINLNEIECDFYDWLKGKVKTRKISHGEYMSQYSWADMLLSKFE
ncbi:MAG: hypothetical protein EOM64_02045 [Erysipelotrichia bacterium]|nr:hypothetical protein [Erysipelotrichia bacterium]